jgi:hypothetical protein
MQFTYVYTRSLHVFYLFILSYGVYTHTLLAADQQSPTLEKSHPVVGIQGNSMKITNGTSGAVTLVIERASVPDQRKEDEYDVINNLQPQATCTLPYEFVAVGDKKQQQITGLLVFPGEAKSHHIPLGKVPKSKVPSPEGARIGIPLKAHYILKLPETLVNQKKVSTYELYAQESHQASPSHHRYFKVEPSDAKTYSISTEVGLVIQAAPGQ